MTLKFFSKFDYTSRIEQSKFIHQVNQVLDSYPGETLMELSISCRYCMLDQRSQFDKWVQFAMTKKVKKLSLDLSGFMGKYLYPKYRFPPIPYDKKRLISRDIGLPCCTSLTDLRLEGVKVTSKQIKYFLGCCPFLESLCVIRSSSLTSLKVDGPIRLKFLEIKYCNKLRVFEIYAPNLISFKYVQYPMKNMPLKCAPQLNELLLSDYDFVIDNFHLFTSYFDQILTLSLVVDENDDNHPDFRWPTGIPTLRNLKNLTIHAYRLISDSLFCFVSWIEASPFLKRFVFKKSGPPLYKGRKAVKSRMCPHQFLKEVEFVGFKGDILDTELVTYIIENAVNIEKMVFDCRDPYYVGMPFEDTIPDPGAIERKQRSRAIIRANKFKLMLSPAVEFVLIT